MTSLPAYQVTVWGDPYRDILSYWGTIPYERYLEMEIQRWMDKDATPCWLQREPGTRRVAMFTASRCMVDLDADNDL